MNPFINGDNFYDTLLSENDSYAETIENFLNADEKWLKKINKDYNYIFHGAEEIKEIEEVKEFFNTMVANMQLFLTNEMKEFQIGRDDKFKEFNFSWGGGNKRERRDFTIF